MRDWVERRGRQALNGICQNKYSGFRATDNSYIRLKVNHGSGIRTHVASEFPMEHWVATERTSIWYQLK